MTAAMTPLQRVLTTLGHQEPDRVPFFLLMSLHGARELGLSLAEYFSAAKNVVEGQLRIQRKYRHDCLDGLFHAALEIAAWGGEVITYDDGPANSGEPFIRSFEAIRSLEPPDVAASPDLRPVLETIALLKEHAAGELPVVGVVLAPFSLPPMQMGFDRYLELMYERPDLFERLMRINEEFCVAWANAQFAAGATAIAYFDPVSSSTITPRETYLKTGYPIAQRTLARFHGPAVIHLASGRGLPILADLAQTGAVGVGVSASEDLAALKAAARGKLTLIGNLNGIEMRRWTPAQAEAEVKRALAAAGPGGGYILSDNHGEIPWQVAEETLMAISDAMHKWGAYPLNWVDTGGK